MHDVGRVGRDKSVGRLFNDPHYARQRHRIMLDNFAKGAAVDELGRKKASLLFLAYLIDRDYVRMVKGRYYPGLLTKAAAAVLVGRKLIRQQLYSDVPPQLGVIGGIHFAHSALAELRTYLIFSKLLSD